MFISIYAKPVGVFSLLCWPFDLWDHWCCSWNSLLRSPVFSFWQRCQEIACEWTGLSSVSSVLPTWGCCQNGSDTLTDRCGNVVDWLITLLELICKPFVTFLMFSIGWQIPIFVCYVFVVTILLCNSYIWKNKMMFPLLIPLKIFIYHFPSLSKVVVFIL